MFTFQPIRIAQDLAQRDEVADLSSLLDVIRRAWAAVRRAIGGEPAPEPVRVPVRRDSDSR